MSKPAQHPKHFSLRPATEPFKSRAIRQSALQAKATGHPPQLASQGAARAPVAPPVYRPQPAPHAAQAKMSATVQPTHTRAAGAACGIIQANIVGGTQALQARLAFLRAPAPPLKTNAHSQAHSTAQRKAGTNLKPSPVQLARPQSIQRKSGNGVEAFQVPLQPKSGGQAIPDQVRAKMETAFGMDFSDVRVHIGQEASSIGAIAYTWGTNIHFAPGRPRTVARRPAEVRPRQQPVRLRRRRRAGPRARSRSRPHGRQGGYDCAGAEAGRIPTGILNHESNKELLVTGIQSAGIE